MLTRFARPAGWARELGGRISGIAVPVLIGARFFALNGLVLLVVLLLLTGMVMPAAVSG